MNQNLFFFIAFSLVFLMNSFLGLSINENSFLESTVGGYGIINVVFGYIIFWAGKKYINDTKNTTSFVKNTSYIIIIILALLAYYNIATQQIFGGYLQIPTFLNEYLYYKLWGYVIIVGFLFSYIYRDRIKKDLFDYASSDIQSYKITIILFIILCFAFGLRIIGLDQALPYTDEYLHLIAAKQLIAGVADTDVYQRSLYLVTYPVYFLFSYFQENLFYARLPGVIANTLTIIPLYFLGAKINKRVGIIVAILFCFSPWMIAIAKAVREYAYYPLIFATITLCIVNNLSRIKQYINQLFMILILIGVLAYSYIDPLSNFKIFFLIFLLISSFFLMKNTRKQFSTYMKDKKKMLLLLPIFLIGGVGLYIGSDFINIVPTLNSRWYKFFLLNNTQHWFILQEINILIILLVSTAFYFYTYRSKNFYYVLYVLIFAGLLYFFTFHFDRYIKPRYISHLEIYYILALAPSLYILSSFVKIFQNTRRYIIFLLLSLAVFNFTNFSNAVFIEKFNGKYDPVTVEFRDNVQPSLDYINNKISNNDAVITTIMGNALCFFENVCDNNIYSYKYSDDNRIRDLNNVVLTKQSGWIILDWRRNGYWVKGLPRENFLIEEKNITFHGDFKGIQVYSWGK